MLRKFREVTPDVIILIFFISLLVWAKAFIHPETASLPGFDTKPMPLFYLILSATDFSPVLRIIFTYLLVLLVAFLIVNFNTSQFFMGERTFLPALLFVLFSGLIPGQQVLNPVLPAALFLILALRRIMDAYKTQWIAYSFFDAGLLISIGSMFYAGLIWFGAILFIGIAILRTGNIKEITISILGLAAPWFLAGGICYVAGLDLNELLSTISYNLLEKEETFYLGKESIGVMALFSAVFLISLAGLISSLNTKKIRSRKTFVLLIWNFILALGLLLLLKPVSFEILWLAYIPASFIISHYFVYAGRKKIVPVILFLLLFAGIGLIQVMEFIKGY